MSFLKINDSLQKSYYQSLKILEQIAIIPHSLGGKFKNTLAGQNNDRDVFASVLAY